MEELQNVRKKIVIILLLCIIILLMTPNVFAKNKVNSEQEVQYSKIYQEWLKLSDEEKAKTIRPRMYDVEYSKIIPKNPFLKASMLQTENTSKFNLKDLIPNNLIIKNQGETNSCWTFAALSSLETNLALMNYRNNINTLKVYDFSERHMEYATSQSFNDNQINPIGYNRRVGTGGSWDFATSYLTNGTGAIDESEMPFENNENLIDISGIQGKKVTSQVYDTVEFPNYLGIEEAEANDIKNQIKTHIQNYGSVFGAIKAGSSFIGVSSYVSSDGTVAKGTGGFPDHAISIVGWNDNYDICNWSEFPEAKRPETNGAWIARNSWGEEIGDQGYIYISYEDETLSYNLSGIIKASDEIDYDNLYQYDQYYPNTIAGYGSKVMVCNVFDKKTNDKEYLTQVSLHVPDPCVCKVYLNPKGAGKTKNDLKLVQLKVGDSEKFNVAGYHTLEFAKPIEISSSKFAVAVECSSTNDDSVCVSGIVADTSFYESVSAQEGTCFVLDTIDYMYYDDWSGWSDCANDPNGPRLTTLKAFTTNELIDESLKEIKITTPSAKTSYFEGENFDSNEMVVTAYYNSKKRPSVILNSSDYSISNGTNLKEGQTSVTITYEDKSIEQPITVEKNSVTELKITTFPTKTEYKEGQNFDKTGMIVEATRKNGNKEIVTDYTIEDGNNLKREQTKVTILYEGKEVIQEVTVIPNPLMEIKIKQEPNKTKYVVGQNFDSMGMIIIGIYEDETELEIFDYTIENGTDLKKEQKSVTIKYSDKQVTQEILVEEKSIINIKINKPPNKITYIQNKEDLDLIGGSLSVSYNDDSSEIIDMKSEQVKVSGFDNTKIGKNTITFTYQNKTTTLDIEIIEEVVEKAKNSNLENAQNKIEGIKAYYFTDKPQDDYIVMDLEINNIVRNLENDKLEYYYYLSTTNDEKNITNWTKIKEEQKYKDKLQFTINSKDIKNYEEISKEDVLYLYIKEVSKKGENQSIVQSKALTLNANVNVEVYKDNVKQENINNNNNSNTNNKDNTIAEDKLPYTGNKIIIPLILVILLIGSFIYLKYYKLKDIE